MWLPESENAKIPVAIKELRVGCGTSTREMLEESRVMASVNHPCCIRILAISLAEFPLIITQLMPLGCLLQYIRERKDKIGSKAMLNWSMQIAKVSIDYLANNIFPSLNNPDRGRSVTTCLSKGFPLTIA